MRVETENIRKDVRMRSETDSMLSSAWILIYLLPIIAAFVWVAVFILVFLATIATWSTLPPSQPPVLINFGAFIVALYVVVIISFIAYIVLIYKLARRRNTHFKRQIFLFEDLVAAVKRIAADKSVDVEVGLASCERTIREAKMEETEKNAVLWALLSAVTGLAAYYVWYFLMKDFYRHERREDGFWEDLRKTLDKAGVTVPMPRRIEPTPNRSFILYLILTIVTLGLFGIYWVYVLLQDPNHHFRYHVQIEDQLIPALETAAS